MEVSVIDVTMDEVEERILELELDCEDEELSPAQIAAQEVVKGNYNRATGLVQHWKKNKRKILSYKSDGLQMYSSKPIVPKAPPAPAQAPMAFVSQSGQIVRGVRPVVSGPQTIIIPQGSYNNSRFQNIVRQTRPIQIGNLAQSTIRTQSPVVSQPPLHLRASTANLNTGGVQQLIFDASSGLLIVPQQQQQVGSTIRVQQPANANVSVNAIHKTIGTFMNQPRTLTTNVQVQRRSGPVLAAPTPYNPPVTSVVSTVKTYLTPKIVSSTSLNPAVNKPTIQVRQQTPAKAAELVTTKGISSESTRLGTISAQVNGGTSVAAANAESATGDPNNRTFPSLVVSVKPCLHDKPSKTKTGDSRAELDGRVKALLIHQPSKFTEWLMQRGMLKLEHKCTVHLNGEKEPIPYKLGMYSDGNKQPFSGGYVWISECCTDKQITVFQGSIFEASIYPPGTLLKLIYHWSCQTSAANVLMWVKVTSYYLKNFYTLLRSACVAALHEFSPMMGGKSKFVEVGIITLGTTLAVSKVQNGQKQVKVEILGVFDPTTKVIRMKVINPQNIGVTSASHSRVMQILWPLNHWVDKSSVILIDSSIEKSLLLEMGFKNVQQCKTNAPNTTQKTPTNVNVMNYLKHVVPKMFQNTLCVLSKSLIQQFLDELSWRELWGETPSSTFDTMVNHLVQMTKWETGESLISRLNRISLNPFGEWSYSRGRNRTGIEMLPDSIRGVNDMPELSVQAPTSVGKSNGMGVTITARVRQTTGVGRSAGVTSPPSKPPVLIPQVQHGSQVSNSTMSILKRKIDSAIEIDLNRHYMSEPKTIVLQSYYYAECAGKSMSSSITEFPSNLKCPLCSKLFISNQEVIRHIFMHVQSMGIRPSSLHGFCEYCLKDVGPVNTLQIHINEVHKMVDIPYPCLICQEKFGSETALTLHMWENHGKCEMPYTCEICDYKNSFHHEVVHHFGKEHAGTDSVLCPLCLKVLSAKSFTCMKQIVVHLQSHTIRKGKKCGQCTLTFNGDAEYRSHVNDDLHQKDEFIPLERPAIPFTLFDTPEIKMAKPPKVKRITIPPPMPPLKKVPRIESSVSNSSKKPNLSRMPMQGDGTEFHFNELNIQFVNSKANSTKCLECLKFTGNEDHFPGYMVCIKCRFATCCRVSMVNHNINVHPNVGDIKLKSSFNVKSAEGLKIQIYCGCGYGSLSGNKMARHLISCEKTTALSELPEEYEDDEDDSSRTSSPMPTLLNQLGLTRKTD